MICDLTDRPDTVSGTDGCRKWNDGRKSENNIKNKYGAKNHRPEKLCRMYESDIIVKKTCRIQYVSRDLYHLQVTISGWIIPVIFFLSAPLFILY